MSRWIALDDIDLEDVPNWVQSIEEFVKNTGTTRLDLRSIPTRLGELKAEESQAIFDALEGSEITDINLTWNRLTNRVKASSSIEKIMVGLRRLVSGQPTNTGRGLAEILPKTKIQKLNLRECRLTINDLLSLTGALKNTRISELDLSKNFLQMDEYIDEFLSHLVNSHITSLNLENNNIACEERGATILAQKLSETQITCLNLGHVSLHRHAKILFSRLKYTAITDLNISNCGLGMDEKSVSSLKVLAEVLRDTKLEKLDLSGNFIGEHSGVDYLVPGLVGSKLTHLNLSGNELIGIDGLRSCLKDTVITDLDLSGNTIERFSSFNFVKDSRLNTLILSRCRLDTFRDRSRSSVKEFGLFVDFIRNSSLTYIDLSLNQLSKECYDILGEALKGSKLKHIKIDYLALYRQKKINSIASLVEKTKGSSVISLRVTIDEPEDAKILAQSLANTPLLALELESHIGSGAVQFARLLKYTNIVYLNLAGNKIGDQGTAALADCLEETQITILILDDNTITSQGATALALVFKTSKLRHLSLKNNAIDDCGFEALAEHARGTCVTFLNVRKNPGQRKLMVNSVAWRNREKIQRFVDLLKRTALSFSEGCLLDFNCVLDGIDVHTLIEDCLVLNKHVVEEPHVVNAVDQDILISNLDIEKCFNEKYLTDGGIDLFFTDCPTIGIKAMKQGKSVQKRVQTLLEEFPREFVSFIGRTFEPDMSQFISLLRRAEELGLANVVEHLLLNRPIYVIDESQNILHPYVYKLLLKYKQPICNLDIEPKGVEKIIEYFTKHNEVDCASEVVSLLGGNTTP